VFLVVLSKKGKPENTLLITPPEKQYGTVNRFIYGFCRNNRKNAIKYFNLQVTIYDDKRHKGNK